MFITLTELNAFIHVVLFVLFVLFVSLVPINRVVCSLRTLAVEGLHDFTEIGGSRSERTISPNLHSTYRGVKNSGHRRVRMERVESGQLLSVRESNVLPSTALPTKPIRRKWVTRVFVGEVRVSQQKCPTT